MFDGEALVGPWVKDAWLWQPLVRELVDPVPPCAVLLAAPRQHAHPEHDDVVPERGQGIEVSRHRVIAKEARHHLAQPLTLAREGIEHPAPQLSRDLPHCGPSALASVPPTQQD